MTDTQRPEQVVLTQQCEEGTWVCRWFTNGGMETFECESLGDALEYLRHAAAMRAIRKGVRHA